MRRFSALTRRLRIAFACTVLQLGTMAGVPMPPEKVQALLHAMNQPTLAHSLPADEDDSGPPRTGTVD